MLSPKARELANKLKSVDEGDLNSISEMIHHEVQHVTDVVTERARAAEARVRQLAEHAGADISRVTSQTRQAVDDNPVTTALIALGVGFVLGAILTQPKR